MKWEPGDWRGGVLGEGDGSQGDGVAHSARMRVQTTGFKAVFMVWTPARSGQPAARRRAGRG